MQDIMKQKTKGEDWKTARKKLITEALARKPSWQGKYKEPPRPEQRKKDCKTCGKK